VTTARIILPEDDPDDLCKRSQRLTRFGQQSFGCQDDIRVRQIASVTAKLMPEPI
jgi:hypothetical protein